ncbi:alpha/beta fold hydrolase [Archangium lipolyticum]|uniref:alpha/beta fold hydrolase n=1 Tax=Archangium lipolyticum TaxID=2970465 RepID=UPI002149A631|nr:alpha/beta hydrolase [Archangium lipolyticum]
MRASHELEPRGAATLPGDSQPMMVQTRRGPVECVSLGEGPAVLALHGAMGGYDQASVLARTAGVPGFRYIAISRPGYLGTSLSLGRTPAEQAELYRDLLDALGIEHAAVMAISGGGPSALQFALSYPDRCWGLVIISSFHSRFAGRLPMAWHILKLAVRFSPFVTAMQKRKARQDPERASRRSITDPLLRARTVNDPEAGPLLREVQRITYNRMPLRVAGTENDIALTSSELSLPLERMKAPMLVMHGTKDSSAPYAQAQQLAARVPGAELLTLEGGEHFCIFSHRDEVRARVGRFLGAHSPKGLVRA